MEEIKKLSISKKCENYEIDEEDFIMEGEITVTITLHEYRELLVKKSSAETKVDFIRCENEKLNKEIKDLKVEIENLKTEIQLSKDAEFISGWREIANDN